jgi:hypothetical protein
MLNRRHFVGLAAIAAPSLLLSLSRERRTGRQNR